VKRFAPILALCLALAFAACGEEGSSGESGQSESGKADTTSTKSKPETGKPTKPEVEVPDGPPPTKLVIEDLKEGSGSTVKVGDEVTVQYVGVEYENGEQIDASWDRGEPFSFPLGDGEVIPGWEEGMLGMKVGGRRQLVIPSDLAYGSGALVFVIDLLEVERPGEFNSPEEVRERDEPKVHVPNRPPPKKVVIRDLKKGSGAVVEPGDAIELNYIEVDYKTGALRGSTWGPGKPFFDKFGTGEVVKGWETGLKGMRVGGRRELIIPSRLAYNEGAAIYVIDLLSITSRPH
jgi:peptidylprolyl isomerase